MGGTGSGIAYNTEEFEEICERGLDLSPTTELYIDQYLSGWKEYEMEVVRDKSDNCIIVCSIENFDPMGVHTGDSITVAPAMTLSDTTYQKMRDMAIKMMRSIGDFAGGCNVQFAVSPDDNEDIIAIEINPRLSRSSALASKATGYPLAYMSAKIGLGYNLSELVNRITKSTTACFEPSLDYVVCKHPRWDFSKFELVNRKLGVTMKSVGEVMAVGRTFEESLQKAIRMLDIGNDGLVLNRSNGKPYTEEEIEYIKENAKDYVENFKNSKEFLRTFNKETEGPAQIDLLRSYFANLARDNEAEFA